MRDSSLIQNYRRLPVTFVAGKGAWLWDADGKKYLDALSGFAVCSLGHAHPAVSEALREQSQRLVHVSNIYGIAEQEELARQLTAVAGMEVAFFCNSGTEANEAAIKLARLSALAAGNKKPIIVTMENAFHGRTFGSLSAASPKDSTYGPLLPGFMSVPFNDISAIKEVGDKYSDVCALMLEPIQGEGGVKLADDGYLSGVRALCDERGWLMILDEVQTGVGRTGAWYFFQHSDAKPDILCTAKALGNGAPIAACLAGRELSAVLAPGKHGSTFGGNPLCCAAAIAVLKTIKDSNLLSRVAEIGDNIVNGLRQMQREFQCVKDVRGRGLMIGIELDRPCADLVAEALEMGLLINVTAGNVVRLLPPFIISDEQALLLLEKLRILIHRFNSSPS